ncbi:MAG: hypothetical protein A4E67_00932 [Syntrophaceae bacterium PtaB.Bin038]|nr:MAG: hypothetical protein A4E67_00932 [Syntrophaceae bacterium PtaB.Bin038]
MLETISGGTGDLAIFTERTARGWISRVSSMKVCLTTIMIRRHLMAPPVEPAQPPMNISSRRMTFEGIGQRSKLTVTNPVVVRMDTTWKAAWRRASPGEETCDLRSRVIAAVATTATER